MNYLGRMIMFAGIALFAVGLLISFSGKIPWLGRLPGDIFIKKDNFTFYFPLTTSVIVSVIFSFILYFSSKK